MDTTTVARGAKRRDLTVVSSAKLEDRIKELRAGLPFSRAERFASASGLPLDRVIAVMRIPARTLVRRRQGGRFSPEESERLDRLSRLFSQALDLFGGQRESTAAWMSRPCRALGEVTPLAMAETEVGAREVEAVIGRLEDGVFM